MVGSAEILLQPNEQVAPVPVKIRRDLFYKLLVFRLINAMVIATYFDPDETYQSLEIAHLKIFGVGYSTWEWKMGIRSSLNIWIFAILYKLIQLFGLDDTYLLLLLPKALQAYFAAVGDYYTVKLANQLFGFETSYWTVFSICVNWFNFYTITRTYSNSLEASLTMVALYYWPSKRPPISTRQDLRRSLAFASIACIIRPTSLLTWAYMGTLLLIEYPSKFYLIMFDVITTGYLFLIEHLHF